MEIYLDDCADSDLLISYLAHAAAKGYALITKDPDDYGLLHHEWQGQGQAHHGILLIYDENIRGKDMEPPNIVRAIGRLLSSGVPVVNELHALNHWR